MEKIVSNLSDEQKRKLVDLLGMVDDILEENCDELDDVEEYHSTDFYNGLYDLMYRLGIWC